MSSVHFHCDAAPAGRDAPAHETAHANWAPIANILASSRAFIGGFHDVVIARALGSVAAAARAFFLISGGAAPR